PVGPAGPGGGARGRRERGRYHSPVPPSTLARKVHVAPVELAAAGRLRPTSWRTGEDRVPPPRVPVLQHPRRPPGAHDPGAVGPHGRAPGAPRAEGWHGRIAGDVGAPDERRVGRSVVESDNTEGAAEGGLGLLESHHEVILVYRDVHPGGPPRPLGRDHVRL